MKPTKHLLLTAAFFFLVNFFLLELHYSILLVALASTILIDVVDHIASISTSRHAMHSKVRQMLRQGKIAQAYSYYFNNRKLAPFSYFHNVYFMVLVGIATLYLHSMALFLGIFFHFACDVFELALEGKPHLIFPSVAKQQMQKWKETE